MITAMIAIFVIGYILIALEHKLEINKATFALMMCSVLWTLYAASGMCADVSTAIIHQLGDTCEILMFLIGAMTIVELIDKYEGFNFITKYVKARRKKKLLCVLVLITFFMSAVLDNMTTTIIMVMLLRRMLIRKDDRWLFAGVIVIAANSGGAWSPIGDVTTIMLWMKNNVTTGDLIINLFIPCIISTIVPLWMACKMIKDDGITQATVKVASAPDPQLVTVNQRLSKLVLISGVAGLLLVPVFKTLTGLPPFMGMLLSLGALWLLTEIIVRKYHLDSSIEGRVSQVVKHIDMPTILFFLGILMAVGSLQEAGILSNMAQWLDDTIHEPYLISSSIGVLSSIVDNVPLVAACINMYPVVDPAMLATVADPAYEALFVQNGLFWHLLTFCAGVGGSLLIIGSAAGVVAMGIEKMPFWWYCKKITHLALAGYVAGIAAIWLQCFLLGM